MTESQKTSETGEYSFSELDRIIHERARLGILTALNAHDKGLLFNQIKSLCEMSDGNLSRHLTVLKEANLIDIWKGSKEKKSQTLCVLSEDGRSSLAKYTQALQQIITKINNPNEVTSGS